MKSSIGRLGASVFVLIFGLAGLAGAQEAPKSSILFAYQGNHFDTNPCTGCSFSWYQYGFAVDGSFTMSETWSVVGEFGWARHPYRENPDQHVGGLNAIHLAGGPRWNSWKSSRFNPYAQILMGFQRDFSTGPSQAGQLTWVGEQVPQSSFMLSPGAGVYMPLNSDWGVVCGRDYRRVFANDAINGFRVVACIRVNRR